jgi:hypothetical protein
MSRAIPGRVGSRPDRSRPRGNPHLAHHVCTTCGGLVSEDGPTRGVGIDRCWCEVVPRTPDVQTAELRVSCRVCATCGLGVAWGHTRWHLHHCSDCVPLVRTINHAAGRLVIPLGIHSIVNGIALRPVGGRVTEAMAGAWLDQFAASNLSQDALLRYGRRLVRHHLEQCDLLGLDKVDVERYRVECARVGIDHRLGWELMVGMALTGRDPFDEDPVDDGTD